MGMTGSTQSRHAAPVNTNKAAWTAPSSPSQGARKPERVGQDDPTVSGGIAFLVLAHGSAQRGGSQQPYEPPQDMASQQRKGHPHGTSSPQQQNGSPKVWSSQDVYRAPGQQQQKQSASRSNYLPPWSQHQQKSQDVTGTKTLRLDIIPTSSAASTFSRGAVPKYKLPSWAQHQHKSQDITVTKTVTFDDSVPSPSAPASRKYPPSWFHQEISQDRHHGHQTGYHHGEQQASSSVITKTRTANATQTQTHSATHSATHSRPPIGFYNGEMPTHGPLLENGHVIQEDDDDTPHHTLNARDTVATESHDLIIPSNLKGLASKLEADLKDKIQDLLAEAKVNDIIAKVVELIGDIKSGDFKDKIMAKIPEFVAAIKALFSMDGIESLKGNVEDVIGSNHGLGEVREWAEKMRSKVEGKNQELIEGLTSTVGGLLGGGGGGDDDDGGLMERAVDPADTDGSGHFQDVHDALKESFQKDLPARKKEMERIKAKGQKLLQCFESAQADLKEKLDKAHSSKDLPITKITEKVKAGLAHITEVVRTFQEKAHELGEKKGTEKVLKDLMPNLKARAEAAIKDAVKKVLNSVNGHLPHVDDLMGDDMKAFLKSHEDDAMRLIADIADKFNAKGKAAGSGSDSDSDSGMDPGAFP
ncbi:hypothetical protein FKW77_008485 [Venturia effusa]|uniref:Uncharacterized protein n=1 Tax=Venturia effusa TaxID=50376 RepID=A0A517KZZ1_9PEZI|nr:hypothetical protein FKW77_008485 [Venturia effusa]